jgi:dihydrofolate synthase/folylpolyglutamate synthase
MNIDQAYQKALDYIYSFVDYSRTRALTFSPEKFDLTRMFLLMEKLDNPQEKFPVIHVAGSKGKGSTAAMMASVLKAAGYRTGFYSSPHLQNFTERIQINGIEIPQTEIVKLVDYIKPIVAQIEQITTFEIITALGFMYLAQQEVDIAVIEVGLGGRLDATNVVTPLISVITSLSLDHTKVLGNTLEEIAFEKGGIIKTGRPVVSAPQKTEAEAVLRTLALERQAQFFQAGQDYKIESIEKRMDCQTVRVNSGEQGEHFYNLSLLGDHQLDNAVTAYTTLMRLKTFGFDLPDEAIKTGFETVSWPGRFEILSRNPWVIIDSAHNPDSAARLAKTIDDYFYGKTVILVFGVSEDKDIHGMLDALCPKVDLIVATESFHPRAMAADELAEIVKMHQVPVTAFDTAEDALDFAISKTETQDAVIITAGSIFIAAAIRDIWLKNQ